MRQKTIRQRVERWSTQWGADEKEKLAPSGAVLVDRIFADCLGFLFVHCFTPEGCSLEVAQRRFLALVYIYRPDLIDARSLTQIADEVNVTKGAIGQTLMAMRREIGASGINTMSADARRRVREGQIKARMRRKKVKRKGRAES